MKREKIDVSRYTIEDVKDIEVGRTPGQINGKMINLISAAATVCKSLSLTFIIMYYFIQASNLSYRTVRTPIFTSLITQTP